MDQYLALILVVYRLPSFLSTSRSSEIRPGPACAKSPLKEGSRWSRLRILLGQDIARGKGSSNEEEREGQLDEVRRKQRCFIGWKEGGVH